jgi:hypothetical protein
MARNRVNEAAQAEGFISCERRIHSGARETKKRSPQPERLD